MKNKVCIICKIEKPETDFYKNSTYTDGRENKCKKCRKAYQTAWRADNRTKHRKYSRKYYKEHKEQRAEYYAGWRSENAEKKAEYDRQWRIANPDRMKERRRIENARRRARLENADGDFTVEEWEELKEGYGNTCLKCGKREPEVKITPDHVVPLALGGSNNIDNIQPLCWGCNAQKQARIADYRHDGNYQLS